MATGTTGGFGLNAGLNRYNYTGSLLVEAGGTFANKTVDQILSGSITGAGIVSNAGTGALRIASDNATFTGTVQAKTGTLGIYRDKAVGAGCPSSEHLAQLAA